MNFYHMTCKILVNGKEASQYLTDHKEVVKAVLGYPQLSTLDEDLLQLIRVKLNSMSGSRKRLAMQGPVKSKDLVSAQPQKIDMVPDCVPVGEDASDGSLDGQMDWFCVHCSDAAESNCIECSKCHEWMHWSCENLTKEVFEDHIANPDSEYICLLCKHDNLSENADDTIAQAPKVDDSIHEGPSGPGINSQALSTGLDVAGPVHSSGDTARTPESPVIRHHSDETLVKVPFATSTVEVLPDSIIPVQHGTSQKQPLDSRGELPPRSASHLISSQSLNLGGRRSTTDDAATIPFHPSLSSAALRESPNPIPVHSLMLSSHLFFCLPLLLAPFTVPCRTVFAMPEDLEMWPYHLSFRFFTMVRRSSCTPIALWILLRTSSFVTWSL